MTTKTQLDPRVLPASFITAAAKDPASAWPGAPPNFGQDVVPHISTISGRFGGSAYYWADEALRDSRTNADKMRTDCGIMECLEARMRAVALLNWHIAPEDDKNQEQKDLADEVTKILKRTPHFTKLRWSLLEAIWFGRAGVALRPGKQWVAGKQRTCINHWEPRHGDKLVFRYDDGSHQYDGDQVGIRVSSGYNLDGDTTDIFGNHRSKIESTIHGRVYWLDQWERRLLAVHKHIVEDGPFEDPMRAGAIHGIGVRDRIYWTWYGMIECLADVLCYLERSAFGIEIWTYPAGNEQARQRTEAAAKVVTSGGRTVLIVPKFQGDNADDFGVQHIEPGLAGIESAMSIITDYFGHRIKRYILGQTLTSEAAATGLGSGVADAHIATFADIVRFDAINLEETITSDIVRWVQAWNFPRSRDIYLRFVIDTDSPDAAKAMQGYKAAWDMGARIKEEDVLKQVGASMPQADDRILQNPALIQASGLAAERFNQVMGGGGAGLDTLGHLFGPLAQALQQEGGVPEMPPDMAQQIGGGDPGGQPMPEQGGGEEGPPPEQFTSEAFDVEKYVRNPYRVQGPRKQIASTKGQMPLFSDHAVGKHVIWKEELHPRGVGGKFRDKGGPRIKSTSGQKFFFSKIADGLSKLEDMQHDPAAQAKTQKLFEILAASDVPDDQLRALLSGDQERLQQIKEIAEEVPPEPEQSEPSSMLAELDSPEPEPAAEPQADAQADEPFALQTMKKREGSFGNTAPDSGGQQDTFWHGMDDEPGQGKLFDGMDKAGSDPEPEAAQEPEIEPEPEPVASEPEPEPQAEEPIEEPQPAAEVEPEPEPEPVKPVKPAKPAKTAKQPTEAQGDRLPREVENELAARSAAGDRSAENDLMKSMLPAVIHIARKNAKKSDDIDELVAEGSMAVMRAMRSYKPDMGRDFKSYAWPAIQRAVTRSKIKRHKAGIQSAEDAPEAIDTGMSSDAQAVSNEQREWLKTAMQDLPERHRGIMQSRLSGKRHDEIAAELGISRQRVQQLEADAQQRLQKMSGQRRLVETYCQLVAEAERYLSPAQ